MQKLLLVPIVSLGLACGARPGIVNDGSNGSMALGDCDRDRNACGGTTMSGDEVAVAVAGVLVVAALLPRLWR